MYLRSLKPETEEYLHTLALKLHGTRKGNLKNTIEDIVEFLQKGNGEENLRLYLKIKPQLPNEALAPNNLDFLFI